MTDTVSAVRSMLRTCFKSCYAARLLRCAVLDSLRHTDVLSQKTEEILMYVQYTQVMRSVRLALEPLATLLKHVLRIVLSVLPPGLWRA